MAKEISRETWKRLLDLARNDTAEAVAVYALIVQEVGRVPPDIAHQLMMMQDDSGKALREVLAGKTSRTPVAFSRDPEMFSASIGDAIVGAVQAERERLGLPRLPKG